MKEKNSNILLIVSVFFMITMGLLSIISASFLAGLENLIYKQLGTCIFGIIIIFIILKLGNAKILKYSSYIYIFCIILLILTLLFGETINGAKCWLKIGPLSFQPSEFMKIGLILELSKIVETFHFKYKKNFKDELKLILKVIILTLIPSILVFIEPDTGSVIMYILIALTLLFISPLRNRWVILTITLIIVLSSFCIIFYIHYPEEFINTFGTSIFYRIDRLINWQISEGMQLENSLIAIGTGSITGMGLKNTPIYIPEAYSDFIFSVYSNNFGLLGAVSLILVIIIFNLKIFNKIIFSFKTIEKYMLSPFLVTIIFSQIQNIAMTLGLLPIMGIPLPFVSYGGSSLITYLIFIGLILNTEKKNNHYMSI